MVETIETRITGIHQRGRRAISAKASLGDTNTPTRRENSLMAGGAGAGAASAGGSASGPTEGCGSEKGAEGSCSGVTEPVYCKKEKGSQAPLRRVVRGQFWNRDFLVPFSSGRFLE